MKPPTSGLALDILVYLRVAAAVNSSPTTFAAIARALGRGSPHKAKHTKAVVHNLINGGYVTRDQHGQFWALSKPRPAKKPVESEFLRRRALLHLGVLRYIAGMQVPEPPLAPTFRGLDGSPRFCPVPVFLATSAPERAVLVVEERSRIAARRPMKCGRCGRRGHTRTNCSTGRARPPAPAPVLAPMPPSVARYEGLPPHKCVVCEGLSWRRMRPNCRGCARPFAAEQVEVNLRRSSPLGLFI